MAADAVVGVPPYYPVGGGKRLPDPAQFPDLFIKRLLRREFSQALGALLPIIKDVNTVVALSAPGAGDNEENMARIEFAALKILAKMFGSGMMWNSLALSDTSGRHDADLPKLVLNGTTEQLPGMRRVAMSLGLRRVADRMVLGLDCGADGVGNTKTQLEVLAADPLMSGVGSIVVVSSDYHGPRLRRMFSKYLPGVRVILALTPWASLKSDEDGAALCLGEARRIVSYAAKGDVFAYPPEDLRQ